MVGASCNGVDDGSCDGVDDGSCTGDWDVAWFVIHNSSLVYYVSYFLLTSCFRGFEQFFRVCNVAYLLSPSFLQRRVLLFFVRVCVYVWSFSISRRALYDERQFWTWWGDWPKRKTSWCPPAPRRAATSPSSTLFREKSTLRRQVNKTSEIISGGSLATVSPVLPALPVLPVCAKTPVNWSMVAFMTLKTLTIAHSRMISFNIIDAIVSSCFQFSTDNILQMTYPTIL